MALEDLRRAADLFRPVFDRTGGIDGWVSMEVSPLLADDTQATVEAARNIHRLADRPNLYVKIPGTPAGVPAIEEAVFAGVPVNVTLLFSQRAIPGGGRRLHARHRAAHRRGTRSARQLGRLAVREPLGRAVADRVAPELRNRLGIAVAMRTYRAHCELLATQRWRDARCGRRT